jgi:hypothetical protein
VTEKKHTTSLKVGDRVRVSYISAMGYVCGVKGTVMDIKHTGAIEVSKDSPQGELSLVHPKQCRRLKKRERRRVWTVTYSGVTYFFARLNEAEKWRDTASSDTGVELREFIEVKKRG